MENIFELNIFEDTYLENMTSTVDYTEFTSYIESLDELINNMIMFEAAVGQRQGIKKGIQNASKTTKDVVGVYNDATSAGGSMINAIFQLVTNSVALVTKILKFIITNLSKIPLALAKLIKHLTELPPQVIAKIRGDIHLYITVDDLSLLQNKIQKDIGDFITLAASFAKEGDYSTGIPILNIGSDFETYKAMNAIYKRLSRVKFEKTRIRMNNKQIVTTYLSPKSVYYKNLENSLKFLNIKKPELEKLAQMADDKFNANKIKGVVSKLSPENQLRAKNSVEMVSKVISIVGNLIRYIMTDISTINKTIMTLLKSDKKNLIDSDNVGHLFPDDEDEKSIDN